MFQVTKIINLLTCVSFETRILFKINLSNGAKGFTTPSPLRFDSLRFKSYYQLDQKFEPRMESNLGPGL